MFYALAIKMIVEEGGKDNCNNLFIIRNIPIACLVDYINN